MRRRLRRGSCALDRGSRQIVTLLVDISMQNDTKSRFGEALSSLSIGDLAIASNGVMPNQNAERHLTGFHQRRNSERRCAAPRARDETGLLSTLN